MKNIKYTSRHNASIKSDKDGNSGNNIILPELTSLIMSDLCHLNDLVPFKTEEDSDDEFTIQSYVSKKFPETVVEFKRRNKDKKITLFFRGRLFVNTYVSLDIPKGYDFDIRNRSGNFKRNINVTMGLIDNPYTGEMGLQLSTYGNVLTELEFATSISQIVVKKVYRERLFINTPFLDFQKLRSVLKKAKKRGANGFGSTGKK